MGVGGVCPTARKDRVGHHQFSRAEGDAAGSLVDCDTCYRVDHVSGVRAGGALNGRLAGPPPPQHPYIPIGSIGGGGHSAPLVAMPQGCWPLLQVAHSSWASGWLLSVHNMLLG